MVKSSFKNDQSGQALVEYILLLVTILSGFLLVAGGIKKSGFMETVSKQFKDTYARTYRYGHPLAKGYPEDGPFNDGGPVMHPRISDEGNFRIFINPGAK